MNWPCPQPTTRSQAASVTDRHAPSPVHRPVASGPLLGAVGLQEHANAATTSVDTNVRSRLTPRYTRSCEPAARAHLSGTWRSRETLNQLICSTSISLPALS